LFSAANQKRGGVVADEAAGKKVRALNFLIRKMHLPSEIKGTLGEKAL